MEQMAGAPRAPPPLHQKQRIQTTEIKVQTTEIRVQTTAIRVQTTETRLQTTNLVLNKYTKY